MHIHCSDIRSRLQADLKASMKSKDTVTATTIRSVLAEVYAADKTAKDGKVPSTTIFSLLRKAKTRRVDAASRFKEASRSDLAEKEEHEANLLDAFLPPLLSEADIDRVLKTIIPEQRAEGEDNKRAMGKVMKAFYSKVDRSTVDPQLVTARVGALLASS
ncbi:hypothetical protein EWM64_g8676 [Hericium alpestre]|uniref:Altered inheritance of mitochondria protein 41 n=1 Tax=Hericium alpestre TaxID=135208 RepID=A0A4Y9ZMN1_9AGAM|nr:hypothetical protein EWM64_g8676 [Hericium alpestre]